MSWQSDQESAVAETIYPRRSTPEGNATPRNGPAPLRACFGVLCPNHGRCARYAAVAGSQADAETMATCLRGEAFPLFVEIRADHSA